MAPPPLLNLVLAGFYLLHCVAVETYNSAAVVVVVQKVREETRIFSIWGCEALRCTRFSMVGGWVDSTKDRGTLRRCMVAYVFRSPFFYDEKNIAGDEYTISEKLMFLLRCWICLQFRVRIEKVGH